ncbi:hypothetical protein QPK87_23490 [Kamptonema cortianum]|nr:hypothetical protein [Kamptonema cortianum]
MLQQVCAEISAIIDPQERSQAISTLSWNEINRLYAEFALQENIPMALRREAFSSIYSIHSLDEVTRGRLRNLIVTFLKDEEFIDPQERSQVISTLSWEERNQVYAELALIEDIPMALRREALSSIYSIDSLDEVTRERLRNLIIIFLSKEELIDPQESLQTISRLSWDERKRLYAELALKEDISMALRRKAISMLPQDQGNRLYAELALKEDIPMALRREAFSSIYLPELLDDVTIGRLGNLIMTFLTDGEFTSPQEVLQMISKLPWEEGNRLCVELALKEDTPIVLRREALLSIDSTYSLDEVTREKLKSLRTAFLNDERFPLMKRLAFLPASKKRGPSYCNAFKFDACSREGN